MRDRLRLLCQHHRCKRRPSSGFSASSPHLKLESLASGMAGRGISGCACVCATRHRRAASLTLKPCPLPLGAHRSLPMATGGQQRAALVQQGWKSPAEVVSEARGSVRSSGFSHSSRISNGIKPTASARGDVSLSWTRLKHLNTRSMGPALLQAQANSWQLCFQAAGVCN